MFFKKNNEFGYNPKILIAPLDWGLGHATRCIPIIHHLLNNGATVVVAADGAVKALLLQEFPQIEVLQLRGYNIRYNKRGWLGFALLLQLPKLINAILNENKWLKNILKTHSFDAVISDNRLGFYNNSIKCIYITHQLTIKTGNRFTEWLAQKIHYRFINKYNECWIPDAENENNLSGDLAHPIKMPAIPVNYLEILSRFEKTATEKKYDLLILLSGPEPQRTVFENILLQQLDSFAGKILFIRGLPENNGLLHTSNKNVEVHNHLNAAGLNTALLQSKMVISRSGYTTIMDLLTLQQKAILVPTPGQTEQEYLGNYLLEKNIFYSTTQSSFILSHALTAATAFPFVFINTNNTAYKNVIDSFLEKIKN